MSWKWLKKPKRFNKIKLDKMDSGGNIVFGSFMENLHHLEKRVVCKDVWVELTS